MYIYKHNKAHKHTSKHRKLYTFIRHIPAKEVWHSKYKKSYLRMECSNLYMKFEISNSYSLWDRADIEEQTGRMSWSRIFSSSSKMPLLPFNINLHTIITPSFQNIKINIIRTSITWIFSNSNWIEGQ